MAKIIFKVIEWAIVITVIVSLNLLADPHIISELRDTIIPLLFVALPVYIIFYLMLKELFKKFIIKTKKEEN